MAAVGTAVRPDGLLPLHGHIEPQAKDHTGDGHNSELDGERKHLGVDSHAKDEGQKGQGRADARQCGQRQPPSVFL